MDVSCTNKPPNPSTQLLSLPTEMLLEIFSYFSDDTAAVRKILAPVSKDFYELTNDTTLLGELQFYSHCGETKADIHERFEKFCSFLLALDGRLSHADTLIIDMWQYGYNISKFCDPGTWALLCSKLHGLQTLFIRKAILPSSNFITTLPPTLTHLHLVDCVLAKDSLKAFEDDNFLPQLKCFHFECEVDYNNVDRELGYLSRAVNKLQSLFLDSFRLTAEALSVVLSHAEQLKSLHIILGCAYRDDDGTYIKTITSVCRKLEYLHIVGPEPSHLALLYLGTRLSNLKRLVLYDFIDAFSIENIWLLCENLGSSVEVRVILVNGNKCLDWTTRTRKRHCDNLTFEKVDYRMGYRPVCIPSGSTAPCAQLHGDTRRDISKLCCPCQKCKKEVETRWPKKKGLKSSFNQSINQDVSCTEKPSPKPSPVLLSLPTEMLLEIFSYFSEDTAAVRKVLAPVSKDFHELTNDSTLLRELQFYSHCREDREHQHSRFEKFCSFLLALDGRLSHADTLIINMWQYGYHISKFCDPGTWALLCSKLHSLQTLLIRRADLRNSNFITALPPTLTHLHLVDCVLAKDSLKAFEDDNFLPQLKCFHFQCFVEDDNADRELGYLSRAVNKLQSLFLCSFGLTAEGLSVVLRHAEQLKSLHISLFGVNRDDGGTVIQTITYACRKLEYLDIAGFKASHIALLYSGTRLSNLKRLVLYDFFYCVFSISIDYIWLLCENLGSSVEVRVILYDDDKCLDWTTRTRKRQSDNLTFQKFNGARPVCILSGSTAPCAQLHGDTKPDISKLCCPCQECKKEVETRWPKKKGLKRLIQV